MTEAALREANQIPAGRRIKPGSLVLVSKSSGLGNAEDISSSTIDAFFRFSSKTTAACLTAYAAETT